MNGEIDDAREDEISGHGDPSIGCRQHPFRPDADDCFVVDGDGSVERRFSRHDGAAGQ
ncbi:hypothetical protein [Natrialba sp. PRR66]|uniref:hypothetical protein n=1 Tax=Natrialba sp. PRR66 TaxID=3098146 RepID=UPI002B1D7821|nr:hypothetical protein [Natrialba sp. PRR66]